MFLAFLNQQRRLFAYSCLSLSLIVTASAAGPAPSERVDAARSVYKSISTTAADPHDHFNHSTELAAAYRQWLPDEALKPMIANFDENELQILTYTMLDYAIESGQEVGAENLEAVFRTLESKGWANDQGVNSMHQYYLMFRQFDKAEAFRRSHPGYDLAAPPPIRDAKINDGARAVLAPNADGTILTREGVDLQAANAVIVIGHPNCHFSQGAVAGIAADPSLVKTMRERAVWLVDPYSSMTDGAVAAWNRDHPDMAYRYVDRRSDWPEINYWGTPSFYFYKDGRLVKKLVGWALEENEQQKAALREGLRLIDP